MSQINKVSESLTDDLYRKTRDQLNTFINETNALLAAGDALHQDRTALAHKRLTAFLEQAERSVTEPASAPSPVAHWLETGRDYVKAHPWQVVGVAAGLGILGSFLLRRRG
ncbi:hypothetical protein N5D61_12400 [Pseudomonas sp. GD03842]|uniref:DUF883 family protein n=1 Tax=Pseudomonas sp. GD03842 TaxID=2975385 RepID=UPI002449DE1B|nr:DUF883 C-terminal domain-containing protein [Pseudomonas sp. GD03842]MDH0747144.1 hypothetical protein [Pseudomonas sp. GD03842]